MRKTTRDAIIGVGTAALLLGGTVWGASALVAPTAEPAAVVVETDEPIIVPTDAPNGLAAEQEAYAAAAEAARIAAEAEAARVAAEQAAAEEAARIAAEQAAADAEAESFDAPADEPTVNEPEPPAPPADYCPDGYVDDPNLGCHSPICAVLEDGTQVPCQ